MREERSEGTDRRNRILEGAREAFLRFGFEHSSMADIAKGAGVTRTALYHHFPGKDEVLQALIKALHERTHRAAIEALEKARTCPPLYTACCRQSSVKRSG